MPTFTHTLRPLQLAAGAAIRPALRRNIEKVTPESPAIVAMTDLRRLPPITIAPDAGIAVALTIMIHANVRLLLVLDGHGAICGLISARDISGELPLQIAAQERIPFDAVRVDQVMTGVADIRPLDFEGVRHAAVRDVVRHLVDEQRHHALVLERQDDSQYVARGIFSATQIGRQLGQEIVIGDGIAQSFAALERMIA